MWNTPSKQTLSKIPCLYKTEGVSLKDKQIHLLKKMSKQQLADSFGISYSHTSQIIKNEKWNEKDYSIEYY